MEASRAVAEPRLRTSLRQLALLKRPADRAFEQLYSSTRARSTSTRWRCCEPGRRRGRHADDVPQRLPRVPAGRAPAQAAQLADHDRAQRLPDALAPGRLAPARGRARRRARARVARRRAAGPRRGADRARRLSFNQRAAIVMRELEGRSYQEIAGVLGLSVSAVEALLFRARRNLQVGRRALGVLTTVPLPGSLGSFIGGGGGAVVAGGAAVGADLVLKAAAVVAVGAATAGVGFKSVQAMRLARRAAPRGRSGAEAGRRAAPAPRRRAAPGASARHERTRDPTRRQAAGTSRPSQRPAAAPRPSRRPVRHRGRSRTGDAAAQRRRRPRRRSRRCRCRSSRRRLRSALPPVPPLPPLPPPPPLRPSRRPRRCRHCLRSNNPSAGCKIRRFAASSR